MTSAPHNIDFERLLSEDTRRRKHAMLYVAVGISTVVVVVAWLILLPSQLKGMDVLNPEEKARWGEVKGELKESERKFDSALSDLREQINKANETGAGGSVNGGAGNAEVEPTRATTDITTKSSSGGALDALRSKLEELEKESTTPDIQPDNHATQEQ